ncbi:MAG: hypothetical protein ABW148_04770 [Sedimenticola sp.]
MRTKTLALLLLFSLSWAALQAMDNTVATGKCLGLTETSTLGTYLYLHGVLFAFVASPLLALPLLLTGWFREIALLLALAGMGFMGVAGYHLAERDPAYHLEFDSYSVAWGQRIAYESEHEKQVISTQSIESYAGTAC